MTAAFTPCLLEFQRQLGLHVRDRRVHPRPVDTEARRVRVYSELVLANLDSIVSTCFPVTRAVLGRRWQGLVRDFCRDGQCASPLFRELPGEFLKWLMAATPTRQGRAALPPWLCELAHYEWVELAVDTMAADLSAFDVDWGAAIRPPSGGQHTTPMPWHDRVLQVNPTAMNLAYRWPVHRIGPDWRPRKQRPTFLLVHRDRRDTVRFTQLTALSSRLLYWVGQPGMTALTSVQAVASELEQHAGAALIGQALGQLAQWMDDDVILGVMNDEDADERAA